MNDKMEKYLKKMFYCKEISWWGTTKMRFFKAFQPFWDERAINALSYFLFTHIVIAALQKYGIGDTIWAS